MHDGQTWPLFFVARDLDTPRLKLTKGQVFPAQFQNKQTLRGLGKAYGIADAWARPFDRLPYVTILDVGNAAMAEEISTRRLTLKQATELVGGAAAA